MAGHQLPPGPGRPKGLPNKTTAILKDAILKAAQTAGGGGEDGIAQYLAERAIDTPGPFLALLGKVLPLQVAGDDDSPLRHIVKIERVVVRPSDTDS